MVLIFTKKNNKQKFYCLLPYLQRAACPVNISVLFNKYIKKHLIHMIWIV